jgi:hypothetical protein
MADQRAKARSALIASFGRPAGLCPLSFEETVNIAARATGIFVSHYVKIK